MAALGYIVPNQDVAVESMGIFAGLLAGVGDPIVVVGGAHLVWIAILQWPANPKDEDGRMLLQDRRLALLAREVGIRVENVVGWAKLHYLGMIGKPDSIQLR